MTIIAQAACLRPDLVNLWMSTQSDEMYCPPWEAEGRTVVIEGVPADTGVQGTDTMDPLQAEAPQDDRQAAETLSTHHRSRGA